MNTLQVRSPSAAPWLSAQGRLLLCAAFVATLLLTFYIHLLHESMTLGEQLRERQRTVSAARNVVTRVAAKRAPVGLAQNRYTSNDSRETQR